MCLADNAKGRIKPRTRNNYFIAILYKLHLYNPSPLLIILGGDNLNLRLLLFYNL